MNSKDIYEGSNAFILMKHKHKGHTHE